MLIFKEKFNCINQLFLELFQKNSKPVILGNLDILGHIPNDALAEKKITFTPHAFIKIFRRYAGYGYTYPK